MELEGIPEPEGSEKSVVSSQEEYEESQEAEERGLENPLLQPALRGDVEGLQKIFEDPEHPHHEHAMQLLLEEDIVGRNLLYAACMAGKSDVIRALAKYGVNLNEKTARGYTLLHCAAAWGRLETLKALVELDVDIEALNFRGEKARDVADRYSQTECVHFLDWADARMILKKFITKSSLIITDPEKGPGKLLKEDKNAILNACRTKNEWLETHPEATISELFEQKQQLEDIVTPILIKMSTPRISKMYTDIIRGESLIICSFTCIFFGIFRGQTPNVSMFRELHVIIGLSFDIFGSTICGYWCTRIIRIILTDLFSNTLTNVVLCFSLVYMTFYLGLIEHEGRDVVIALKTKQAIRNVIAKALKNLTFLWSRGIIDKHEGIEMNKVLLTKIKALNNFPMAIPPPTPDKYLPNIVWMENKDVLIDFFKAFFISLEDLYEGFDVFWPSLEYKIWLNLALVTASQYFEHDIAGEIQGIADVSKLLIILASEPVKNDEAPHDIA
ncbi:ankyrin repeat domain 45 [Cricetulus griseus]